MIAMTAKKVFLILNAVLISLFLINSAGAIDFIETFDDPSMARLYRFSSFKFGDTGNPWDVTGLASGGVNNSGCVRTQAVNQDQDDCWYGIGFNDGDFYWRGCWEFSPDWQSSGLGDQKLTYIYGSGGNLNLFLHGGGDWPPGVWSRQGLELAHYQVAGDFWTPANGAENLVRHTNYLLLREHYNRWICIEHHVDVDQDPWVHTYWVTTEYGVNLPSGTCARIDGRMEFNDYKYLEIRHNSTAAHCTYIKYGAFINENAGYGIMHLDEFVMSDSKIGHPFGGGQDDTTAPVAPSGLDIVQSQ